MNSNNYDNKIYMNKKNFTQIIKVNYWDWDWYWYYKKIVTYKSFLLFYIYTFSELFSNDSSVGTSIERKLKGLLDLDKSINFVQEISNESRLREPNIGRYYYPHLETSEYKYCLTYEYLSYLPKYIKYPKYTKDFISCINKIIKFLLENFDKKLYKKTPQEITTSIDTTNNDLILSDNYYLYIYLEKFNSYENSNFHNDDTELIKLFLANPKESINNITLISKYIYYRFSNYNIELIEKFIGNEANNLTIQDEKGQTPLHLYLKLNKIINKDIIKLLLKDDDHKLMKDIDNQTPLHLYLDFSTNFDHTIINFEIEIIELLLKDNDHKIMQNKNNQTPLHLYLNYCITTNDEIIELLLKDNDHKIMQNKNNQTPLHLYLTYRTNFNIKTIELLLNDKDDDHKIKQNKHNETPLHLYLNYSNSYNDEIIKLLFYINSIHYKLTDIRNNPLIYYYLKKITLINSDIVKLLINHTNQIPEIETDYNTEKVKPIYTLLHEQLEKKFRININFNDSTIFNPDDNGYKTFKDKKIDSIYNDLPVLILAENKNSDTIYYILYHNHTLSYSLFSGVLKENQKEGYSNSVKIVTNLLTEEKYVIRQSIQKKNEKIYGSILENLKHLILYILTYYKLNKLKLIPKPVYMCKLPPTYKSSVCLIMEYIDTTLEDYIKKAGIITRSNILGFTFDKLGDNIKKLFLTIYSYLYNLNYKFPIQFYHGDLKINNIMVYNHETKPTPLLIDFGYSQFVLDNHILDTNTTEEHKIIFFGEYNMPSPTFYNSPNSPNSHELNLYKNIIQDMLQLVASLNWIHTYSGKFHAQNFLKFSRSIFNSIEKHPLNMEYYKTIFRDFSTDCEKNIDIDSYKLYQCFYNKISYLTNLNRLVILKPQELADKIELTPNDIVEEYFNKKYLTYKRKYLELKKQHKLTIQ